MKRDFFKKSRGIGDRFPTGPRAISPRSAARPLQAMLIGLNSSRAREQFYLLQTRYESVEFRRVFANVHVTFCEHMRVIFAVAALS